MKKRWSPPGTARTKEVNVESFASNKTTFSFKKLVKHTSRLEEIAFQMEYGDITSVPSWNIFSRHDPDDEYCSRESVCDANRVRVV